MMRDVVTEGTAAGLRLGPDVYAKTLSQCQLNGLDVAAACSKAAQYDMGSNRLVRLDGNRGDSILRRT
jgi:hypothetical protein